MKSHRQIIGAWGEALAAEKLRERGFDVLAQNYHTPYGELDLIVANDDLVIFIEVKTRTNQSYGLPEESVTMIKKEHILQSVEHFLGEHPEIEKDWRVDVVAIQGKPGTPGTEMVWFENALA